MSGCDYPARQCHLRSKWKLQVIATGAINISCHNHLVAMLRELALGRPCIIEEIHRDVTY